MGRDTITQETVETIKETGRRKIEKGRMRLVDGGGHRRFHHKRGSGGELSSSFVPFIDIVSLCRCEGEAVGVNKIQKPLPEHREKGGRKRIQLGSRTREEAVESCLQASSPSSTSSLSVGVKVKR
ncbi:hypothetical protein L2E82_38612 [Cichorium intybus]|uniref:Uncharacterized protein n=1 Tax=Cichorium intybus TaxID=13427 RepID=A0ACB9AFH6_CICIN|nr:hypothetical protein L2E82_38612 [Cichorium intybus]